MPYSLTISWTAASPAPSNGYRVKYWPTSNPSNITTVTPNVSGTTYTITGLTETSYSGTVESACGGGNFSTAQNFSATYTPTYYYYALNEYACSTCTLGSTNKVGRSTSVLSTSSGTHYKVGSNTYVVTNQITPAPGSFDVDLDTFTQTGTTCSQACNTPSGQITITNSGGTGAEITNITPSWFYIDSGTIPLSNNSSAIGGHSGYNGDFGVSVTGVSGGCLTLWVNNAIIQNIGVTGAGVFNFANVSIPSNATVLITLTLGACQ